MNRLLMTVLFLTAIVQVGCSKQFAGDKSGLLETPSEKESSSLAIQLLSQDLSLDATEHAYVTKADLVCEDERQNLAFSATNQEAVLYRDVSACEVELKQFAIQSNSGTVPFVYEPSGRNYQNFDVFTLTSSPQESLDAEKIVRGRVSLEQLCIDGCHWTEVKAVFRYSEILQETFKVDPIDWSQDSKFACKVVANYSCQHGGTLLFEISNCSESDVPVNGSMEYILFLGPQPVTSLEALRQEIDQRGKEFSAETPHRGSRTTIGALESLSARFVLRKKGESALQIVDLNIAVPESCGGGDPSQTPGQSPKQSPHQGPYQNPY